MQTKLNRELEQYRARGFDVKSDPKDPLGLIIIVPEGLLNFASGSPEIPPAGLPFLQQIIPKMADTICAPNFKDEINSIVVEGHTDSKGDEKINLPLSQNRSMSVVQKSLEILQNNSNRQCFLGLVSATGRGSADPFRDANNNPDDNRSRRVIFKIRVRSLEQKQVTQIVGSAMPSPTP